MTLSLTCQNCHQPIAGQDEDDLVANVQAHVRTHAVAAGRDHEIPREQVLARLRGGRAGGTGAARRHAAAEETDAAAIVEALTTPPGRADPYPWYARARGLGPASRIAEGWFLVSGYAAVDRVLRDPGFGMADASAEATEQSALAALSRSILRANPPDHGRMRSLISSVFTPRRIAGLRPAIEAAVDELLDALAAAGSDGAPVDFMEEFAFRLPVSVICEMLGVPQTDRSRFRSLAADLGAVLELASDESSLVPAGAAAAELADYFRELIAASRAMPRDDLIGALVAARDAGDGRLSDVELVANLVVLLVAGFETTTNLLGNALSLLFRHPEIAARLRSEDLPVAAFVEEVLRFDSPVQATSRVARVEELSVEGVPIPVGSRVLLLIGAANRDPDRFPDPDRFDPDRSDGAPLSFGAGAHICLGNNLARLEAAIAVPRLLARFPDLALAGEPTRRDRLVLRGFQVLPITVSDD